MSAMLARRTAFYVLAATLVLMAPHFAQSSGNSIPVTPDNFVRAETDMYFKLFASRGALGKFFHYRELPLENTGVRPNRDTLYSEAVFDLDAGPVTITLPDAGKRFMSLIVIDRDHYVVEVTYGAGARTYTREGVGTRYIFAAVRTLIDPAAPDDFKRVHALQDSMKVSQQSVGKLEAPNWDPASQKKVRDALLVLSDTLPDLRRAFGTRSEVDPVRHLITAASAWGGNPDKDAIYLNVTPSRNDGRVVYKLNVPANVPVDAFWSVIVYDDTGHLKKNRYNAYSLSSVIAKKETDGSVAMRFGGCDGKVANCLPIMSGWNYMVRLYRPRAEVLSDKWKFPEALPE